MSRLPYERPAIVAHRADIANHFGKGTAHKVVSEVDGLAVSALCERYGSPLFVFSERTLRGRLREARRAFTSRYPRVRLAWSYKTNYLDAICGIIHQEGWDAEVVSELEYQMARRLGVPGERIIINGAWKPEGLCERAISEGAFLQLDHFDDIDTVEKAAERANAAGRPPVRVGLRINLLAESLGVVWERFGFSLENGEAMDAVLRIAESPALRLIGVHCHLGTFITLPSAYAEAARKLCAFVREVEEELGHPIEMVNLGGGFPSNNALLSQLGDGEDDLPNIDAFAEAICDELGEAFADRKEGPQLVLESGRALVDQAGTLIATCVGTRRLSSGQRGVVLDAGLNVLYTAHWYRHQVFSAQEVAGRPENTALHGPLCMNIDTVRHSIVLPPLQAGHRVVIRPVGAYNVTQWMQFSQPRPAVVLIAEDGEVHLIRRAEGLLDVKGAELLPERFSPEPGRRG